MFSVGELETAVLYGIIAATIFVGYVAYKLIRNQIFKITLIFMLFAVFMYSGYGIAYTNVENSYLMKYVIYIIALAIPFILFGRKSINGQNNLSNVDSFLIGHPRFLKNVTLLYFTMMFIPLVYPEFRLFDIFIYGGGVTENFYDDRNMYKANFLITIVDMVKMFLTPFFYAYLVVKKQKSPKSYHPTIIMFLSILMAFLRYRYFSRYQMVVYGVELYVLTFGLSGFKLSIAKKHVLIISGTLVALIPVLYAFTMTRIGRSVDEMSFIQSLDLLIASEAYYPVWYNHILNSGLIHGQTAGLFLLWLLCLPIPSFIWPSKPKISADEFTYSITGKRYTDAGYSSFLPSAMGEGLMFFGEDLYWVHALVVGLITALILKFLIKNKTMIYYVAVIIITSLIFGRGAAGSFIPPLVNGVMPIFVMSFLLRHRK